MFTEAVKAIAGLKPKLSGFQIQVANIQLFSEFKNQVKCNYVLNLSCDVLNIFDKMNRNVFNCKSY